MFFSYLFLGFTSVFFSIQFLIFRLQFAYKDIFLLLLSLGDLSPELFELLFEIRYHILHEIVIILGIVNFSGGLRLEINLSLYWLE